ncbi:ATP-dependent DNA helicase RecG [Kamptonema cortianum]|nr:ATP-dependent DNA helicase RecG [Kamptonema cortianum]
MPSALETLVKVLKLERDHGYSNKAMVGGLSAFSGGWAAQAHAQARRPEHHALVDELSDRLRDYDQAPREDRHALVNYLLERIVGRAPMPAEYQSRLEEYARRMAEGFYPAPRSPENEREPAVQRGQPGGRSEQGERRENERRERPDRRERRSREAPPTAKQADSASSPSGQTPGSGAGNQQNRPPKGDRGQQERKGGQKQNQPQAQKSRKDQGRSQPRREEGTSSERENIGGGRPDEFNGMEYEFRGGSGVLDLPARPQLTRVPRAPRRAMSKEEAADILQGLNADVETINGVGEKMAELLHRVGIRTINDFLFYLPRRYDDYTQLRYIARLTENELVTVIGTVRTTQVRIAQRGRRDFVLTLDDGTAQMEVIFYGQFFLNRVFREGQQVVLRGRVSRYRSQFQLVNPEYEIVDPEDLRLASIVPVYPLTEGLSGRWMRRTMSRAIEYWAERLPDYVPEGTLERTELADLGWALKNIHFPESFEHLHHAKRRFIFDQLLLLQLAILGNRRIWQSEPGIPLQTDDAALESFIASAFPYPLTGAQRRAIHDIRRDIERPVPMNRLLQGDVGAGKTAVAAAAMVMAFMNGKQSALMAPTGILAEQHYRNLSAMMERFPAERKPRIALLTGSLSGQERETVYRGLADGSIDMVVGTHAVIQQGVSFADLALAIIDEQHRFGVEQRGLLRGKGANPHLLVMTATPIPRTLALTIYADLDLSILDEMPPGRIPVHTRQITSSGRERAYQMIEEEVERGHQAFIVYPLVEASETIEAESAVEAFENLRQNVFRRERLGLLHGRMKAAEKDDIMAAFRDGAFDILVTTSVAEVGVDIPNATVIMIEGANRFGLAQLHQFRGRVGRSGLPSYCLLVSDTPDDTARDRLNLLVQHNDGFRLAEEDWKLRGAGDLVGTRQSGGGSMLQLAEDISPELVELAQREARTIYEDDPELRRDEHHLLAQRVRMIRDDRSDLS